MRTIAMKAAVAAAVVMLTWVLPAAAAGSGGGYSISFVGSYTPEGMTTPVDVYSLTLYNYNPGGVIGAIDLCVGRTDAYGNPIFPNIFGPGTHDGSDPFQAWIDGGKASIATPSPETAPYLGVDSNAYLADSHFLVPSAWEPAVFTQGENNDLSLWDGAAEVQYGLGSIALITAVPVWARTNAIEIMQVGVLRGTTVYADLGLWDGQGNLLIEKYYTGGDKYAIDGAPILVPEPMTVVLLAAAALGTVRRRR